MKLCLSILYLLIYSTEKSLELKIFSYIPVTEQNRIFTVYITSTIIILMFNYYPNYFNNVKNKQSSYEHIHECECHNENVDNTYIII